MKHLSLVFAMLLSLPAAAMAQGKKDKPGPLPGEGIDWKGDWTEATKESNARNVPVMFTVHNDGGQDSKDMADTVYIDPKIIEASKNFVSIIAHQDTGHGEKEFMRGREKLQCCKMYYTIPCSVHTEGYKGINKYMQGNFTVPMTVFCDQVGKELFRKQGKLSSGDLLKEMEKALRMVSGEHVNLNAWNDAKKKVADAEKLLEKKDYKNAIQKLLVVRKMKPGFGFKDMSQPALDKADKIGQDMLKEALDLQDVEAKKKALKKIVDDFKGVDAAYQADKELDKLK